MIDSIYPNAPKYQAENIVPHSLFTSSRCKPEISFLISNQLKASARMVEDWKMPSWSSRRYPTFTSRSWTGIAAMDGFKEDPSMAGSVTSYGSASSFSSSQDRSRGSSTTAFAVYSDDDIDDKLESKLLIKNSDSPSPPPTILLRCNEYVPVSKSKTPGAVSRVDIARDCRTLGWDEYNPDLVQYVLDIPGHHFNVFTEENVSPPPQQGAVMISRVHRLILGLKIKTTGTRIKEACDILERIDMGDGYKACVADCD